MSLPNRFTCQRHPEVEIHASSHGAVGDMTEVSVPPCPKCLAGVPSALHPVNQTISVAAGSEYADAHIGGFFWTDYNAVGEPTGTGAASGGEIQKYYEAWRAGRLRIEPDA